MTRKLLASLVNSRRVAEGSAKHGVRINGKIITGDGGGSEAIETNGPRTRARSYAENRSAV